MRHGADMNAVRQIPDVLSPLTIEWNKVSDSNAVLTALGADVTITQLDQVFAAAADIAQMLIPASLCAHPAIQQLRCREDNAWELTGGKSFLQQAGANLSYQLHRCEPLVG